MDSASAHTNIVRDDQSQSAQHFWKSDPKRRLWNEPFPFPFDCLDPFSKSQSYRCPPPRKRFHTTVKMSQCWSFSLFRNWVSPPTRPHPGCLAIHQSNLHISAGLRPLPHRSSTCDGTFFSNLRHFCTKFYAYQTNCLRQFYSKQRV